MKYLHDDIFCLLVLLRSSNPSPGAYNGVLTLLLYIKSEKFYVFLAIEENAKKYKSSIWKSKNVLILIDF